MKNKPIGSSCIFAGSVFLGIYALYTIYLVGKFFIESNHQVFQWYNLLFSLIVIIVAIFGYRQKDNVDAGRAIMNRGIFIAIVYALIFVANMLLKKDGIYQIPTTTSMVLALDIVIYTLGGFLNNKQSKFELEK